MGELMEQNAESLLKCVVEYGQPAAKQHISDNTWTFVPFLLHAVAFIAHYTFTKAYTIYK